LAQLFFTNFLRKKAIQSPRTLNFLWRVEGGIVSSLAALGRLLPPDTSSAFGRRLLRWLGPHLDKTRKLRTNLMIAFPEKNAAEIESLVADAWANVGAVLGEFPHLARLQKEASIRFEYVTKGDPEVFKAPGKVAVFVAAHLANWEIAPAAIIARGVALTGIYTPLVNPWLDGLVCRARDSIGLATVPREGAARQLMRQIRQGRSIGLLVDQRVDSGERVPFFGHDMLTATTPAQFALRFDCELIPVQVQRLDGARFRVIFHEPVVPDDARASEHEKIMQMTRKVSALFEAWIRDRPHEWMCSKRRWDKDALKLQQPRAEDEAPQSTTDTPEARVQSRRRQAPGHRSPGKI
jgi:KDO2-lipid IV(A) lauroyltransferase